LKDEVAKQGALEVLPRQRLSVEGRDPAPAHLSTMPSYTPAHSPADSGRLHPTNMVASALISLSGFFLFPTDLQKLFPPKCPS
jgi:hypothetical protein